MDQKKYVFSSSETARYRFPTHINDLVMNRSEAETSEVFIVVLDPGEAPPVHVHHDTEQIFYMIQGTGVLRIGEDASLKFRVNLGDVIRIPLNTFHSLVCDGKEPIVYLSINCFVGGRPKAEPTWESHVHVLCEENGWDFNQVSPKTTLA
jgi:mannose-6-phosphate isomerase-like protein (cupin superfamily)